MIDEEKQYRKQIIASHGKPLEELKSGKKPFFTLEDLKEDDDE